MADGVAATISAPQNVYNLRYPGQYYDSETGLNYNYFRDYDPQTGRYIESDPIGLQGGANTYSYVGDQPLSSEDPTGLIVRGSGCSNKQWAAIEKAAAKVSAKLNNSSCPNCVPDRYQQGLRNKLDTGVVGCAASTGNCGHTRFGQSANIEPLGFKVSVCGCLESTLLHELLHLQGIGSEPTVSGIEKKCFPCGTP